MGADDGQALRKAASGAGSGPARSGRSGAVAARGRGSTVAFMGLLAATAVALVSTLHFVAYVVPTEATMGIVQKIFYFHVPAAYSMYLGATACFIGSAGYLARGTKGWDSFAKSGAEVAVAMGLMVLISGP